MKQDQTFTCIVKDIINGTKGKLPNDDSEVILTPFSSLLSIMKESCRQKKLNDSSNDIYSNPEYFDLFMSFLDTFTSNDFADQLVMTLPGDRIDFYKNPNYEELQKNIIKYVNTVQDKLGFYPVEIEMPILIYLQAYNYAILFLALLFRIVITMFMCISVLLVYSLLSVSVE
jgi:hypothetical protein